MVSATRHAQQPRYEVYSAACLSASPTYWKWVKLTAADVHALRAEPSFPEKDIWFHLNHPIRHVYLCGAIAAIQLFSRFVLVTLDDGSGATVEVKISMVLPPAAARAGPSQAKEAQSDSSEPSPDEDEAKGNELGQASTSSHAPVVETVPTTVDNVEILQRRVGTICYETLVQIDSREVEVGAVMVAKGTLNCYKGVFQMQLLRASIVKDLQHELRVWREYASFAQSTLCRPWRISDREVENLESKERSREAAERQRQMEAAQRRRKADEKQATKRLRWSHRVKKDEQRLERQRADEEIELNGNALDRPRSAAPDDEDDDAC